MFQKKLHKARTCMMHPSRKFKENAIKLHTHNKPTGKKAPHNTPMVSIHSFLQSNSETITAPLTVLNQQLNNPLMPLRSCRGQRRIPRSGVRTSVQKYTHHLRVPTHRCNANGATSAPFKGVPVSSHIKK